jgi:hypothetical protein
MPNAWIWFFAEPSFPDYDREIVVRPILETIWGISVKLPEQTALSSYDQLSWYVPTFLQPSRQDFSQNLKPRLLGFTMLSDKPLPDLPIQSILSTESAASNWVDIDHVSLHQSGGVAVRVDDENTYPPYISTPRPIDDAIEDTGRDFDQALALLPSITPALTPQGFNGIKNLFLTDAWEHNPAGTIAFLLDQGESLWYYYRPYEVLDIIGYEKAPLFQNLYYYALSYPHPRRIALPKIHWAFVLKDRFPKLEMALPFLDHTSAWTAGDFWQNIQWLEDRGISTHALRLKLKNRAGVLAGSTPQLSSPQIDQLLARAILIRLGEMISFPELTAEGHSSHLANLPEAQSLRANKLIARVLAGIGTPETGEEFRFSDLQIAFYLRQLVDLPKDLVSRLMKDRLTKALGLGFTLFEPAVAPKLDFGDLDYNPTSLAQIKTLVKDGLEVDQPFRSYQLPYSGKPVQFDAQPAEKELPEGFVPVSNIGLQVYGTNQDYEISVVLIAPDGQLFEAPMGRCDFNGAKELQWIYPRRRGSRLLAFKEIRIYWNPDNQQDGYLPLEVNLGKLTLEGRTQHAQ